MRAQTDTFQLCASVKHAIDEVQEVLGGRYDICDTMESFWSLQDGIARLVEAAHDYRGDTFAVVDRHYPTLIEEVFDLLTTARQFPSVYGVKASCAAIDKSLLLLKSFKQQSRAAGAGVFSAAS